MPKKSRALQCGAEEGSKLSPLNLSTLPPVFVLASHLSIDEQREAEQVLSEARALVTYDISEARLILGNIFQPKRAKLELQWKGIEFEENSTSDWGMVTEPAEIALQRKLGSKRRRLTQNLPKKAAKLEPTLTSTDSESEDQAAASATPLSQLSISEDTERSSTCQTSEEVGAHTNVHAFFSSSKYNVIVAKLDWLHSCVREKEVLPLQAYVVFKAKLIQREDKKKSAGPQLGNPTIDSAEKDVEVHKRPADHFAKSANILARAQTDARPTIARMRRRDHIKELADDDIVGKSFSSSTQSRAGSRRFKKSTVPAQLLHQTTSENEEDPDLSTLVMPDWVKQNKIYSCERSTPEDSPNEGFISLLKRIRLARQLTLDGIGVRAYSTSIASIGAYPTQLRSGREILSLPGCDMKIAALFNEYRQKSGHLQAVDELESDPALKCLREFFEIWGVGASTAREFYYHKGWRDLDDVIEYGWDTLNRAQQIGLKYYDEFQLKIPRVNVEDIAATIAEHAVRLTDYKIQCAIVGGYRRGKPESGDVDVILSHPDESRTLNIVERIVKSLESEGWITHTLALHITSSLRNQETLPINTHTPGGHGFDTLDKALVVWQDPTWPTKSADLAANPKTKNPNLHRRVDIIISPWRTVGCAVAGWTSGTTFQRDLRRYCKHVKGWKFDSSGVRERGSGQWVDLEGWRNEKTRCKTWQEAEKKVFAGLGLEWREPWERCTG